MAAFKTYSGTVQSVFSSTDQEMLADLKAVVDAVRHKPVRLTKSGIPPKPLWSAINQRLIWSDPQSLLYDWEEVDQVRFTFRLATGLDLVRPDDDLWLHVGAGADQFFLGQPLQRAQMILRTYLCLFDWDERSDARDEQGHRMNFGKAFRRDFIHDVMSLRQSLWAYLQRMPAGWVCTSQLAKTVSEELPDLMMSEACTAPELDDDGIDPEKLRLVNYWLTLLGRFGWADMARSPGDDPAQRLFRLSKLGRALVFSTGYAVAPVACLTIDDKLTVRMTREAAGQSEMYAASRLAESVQEKNGLIRAKITERSLGQALNRGVDLEATVNWLVAHCEVPPPDRFVATARRTAAKRIGPRLVENCALLELTDTPEAIPSSVRSNERLLLAAGADVPNMFKLVRDEPQEGFDYPVREPMAIWETAVPGLSFHYEALPLIHRDLLITLGATGDPPVIVFSPANLKAVLATGWTVTTMLSALAGLTLEPAPEALGAAVEAMAK